MEVTGVSLLVSGFSSGIGLTSKTLFALMVIAFIAGVGITLIGPGGILITIALTFTLSASALVAGTAGATNIATGLVGSAIYTRSGELRTARGKRIGIILSVTGILGALVGTRLNALVSVRMFELFLGGFVALAGVLTWYQQRTVSGWDIFATDQRTQTFGLGILGFAVGVPGGMLGVGGPVLAVPLLIAVGTPLVLAVAVAQVQSVFIAGFATLGYLVQGAVSVPLVTILLAPELLGVTLGWHLAHTLDAGWLTRVLAALLPLVGAYIVI